MLEVKEQQDKQNIISQERIVQFLMQSNLRDMQQDQILECYRADIYSIGLKFNLLIKMLEEKRIFASGEFERRWPLYLTKEVGFPGLDGQMEGVLKVTFYEDGQVSCVNCG